MPGEFEIGVAAVDITPPLSVPYLGFVPRHARFEGIHDPLRGRAVYLSDGEESVVVLATESFGFANDVLGPERNFTNEVRERIALQIPVSPGAIMVTGSHAHSTPDTLNLRPLLEELSAGPWLEVLMEQLRSAACMAYARRFRAEACVAKGAVEGISRNRRAHLDTDAPVDTQVVLLAFREIGGPRCAFLVHFAAHPVTVQVQELVSADYPGVMSRVVESFDSGHVLCGFLQGACGDINPIRNTSNFDDVEWYGHALAGEVTQLAALTKAHDWPTLPARIGVASRMVDLPSRPLPDEDEVLDRLEKARRTLDGAQTESERARAQAAIRAAEEPLYRLHEGAGPFKAEIQAMRIGDVVLLGIPGEPFCRMGLAIKAMRDDVSVLPVGYANGYLGYLAPPESWEAGGYEVQCGPWSKVGPDAYDTILDAARELVLNI